MKIEDVQVGMKVKLVSTLYTDDELGYNEDEMFSVGKCGEVVYIDDDYSVKLSDGYWYSVKDLEPHKESYLESQQNTNIGNLTVNISLEDKQEIAKDILKIVLNDFNKVITDAIAQLDADDNEDQFVEIKEAENVLNPFSDQRLIEITEQALKEVFKETFLNSLNK